MPLQTCPDCDREISDQALACPGCGRPTSAGVAAADTAAGTRCTECGANAVTRDSGIHGPAEIGATLVLLLAGIIPGLISYFYFSSQPWCTACQRRPGTAETPRWRIYLLLGVLVFVLLWAFALVLEAAAQS